MDSLQTFILLMFVAALLIGLAIRLRIPYPIVLVIGGAVLGFIPGLNAFSFEPNLILVFVLPPLLYYAAFAISFREFKRNWHEIFSLALGLVFATTLVVGVIFKWIFPELPWALAFAFGAIISPPDAVATTSLLKHYAIGPRLLSILEGESLINDASALVLYKLAVTALLTGTFSLFEGSIEFITAVIGGVGIGIITGVLLQMFSRQYLDPVSGVVFSFTIPYITFILSNYLGASGVLAVVVNGLIGSKVLMAHHSSYRRILGFAIWDIFNILLNCFVFILIGLQLRILTTVLTLHQMLLYVGYACLITLAMIAVRMAWVYSRNAFEYIKALRSSQASKLCPQILREAALVGWSGMRGIVSLAAALALPLTLPNGTPIEGRNEVIFIAFVVILLTLIVPGSTLPFLMKWLKIHYHVQLHGARRARKKLEKVAEEHILGLYESKNINDEEFEFLKLYFNLQRSLLEIAAFTQKDEHGHEKARLKVLQAQRRHLLEMWERQEIDDKLLNILEHELDVQETHIARIQL